MELTSLDIRYVARELQQMIGAKVEKVFQDDGNKRDLLFVMYLRDAPKLHLRFLLPSLVYLMEEKPVYPQQPPGFAMFLRKYLGGTRLQGVEQQGFDRILRMTFASKTTTYVLVVEFMHPGNMLLLDQDGRIINLLENQQFKDRTLRGKQPYVAPPSVDISTFSDDELSHRITTSTRDSIVTTLAIHCQLGGVYAEEVCVRAGIVKSRSDLVPKEVEDIVRALRDALDQPIQAHNDERRSYPFAMRSRPADPSASTSFLRSMAGFIEQRPAAERKEQQRQSPKGKLQAIIDAQQSQIARFEEEIGTNQRKAERLFEEYQLLQEILAVAHETRAKKQDIAAALARFSQVKSYNTATGEVELEL
jgi:predicted ribosome quality control (RQC) complex YloA/Tae2 family protein